MGRSFTALPMLFGISLLAASAWGADELETRLERLIADKQFGTARAIAEANLARNPEQPALWLALGRICEYQKNTVAAVKALREGQKYGPLPEAAEWLSRLFYRMGQTPLAIREAEHGILQSPGNARLYYCAGMSYDKNGNDKNALERLERAVELDPLLMEAQGALVLLHLGQGREAAALAVCGRMSALAPDHPWTRYAWGRNLLAAGDYVAAATEFTFAFRSGEAPAEWVPYYGEALVRAQRYDEAETVLRRAAEADPTNSRNFFLLGEALMRRGKLEEARRYLQVAEVLQRHGVRGLDALDPSEAVYPYAYVVAAAAHRERGETDQALACAKKALAVAPDLLDARAEYGMCLWDAGRLDDALAILDSLHPDALADPHHLCRLGELSLAAGRQDVAKQYFEQALGIDPTLESAANQIGAATRELYPPAP